MDKKELLDGVKQLDDLSQGDYRKPLATVLSNASTTEAADQLSRLIGVTLKAPFAHSETRASPSLHTHSWRDWELDLEAFEVPDKHGAWQYRALEALRGEPENQGRFGSIRDLAVDAHQESGFFGYLARSVEKYLCADTQLRDEIKKSVNEGKAAGFDLKVLTPKQLVQSGGVALASILITHVPILGLVGSPVIAGFVLLLYTIGVDAFCDWVKATSASKERS